MAALAAQALADQAGAAARVAARRGDLDAALAAQGEARTLADRQRRRRDALRRQRELQAAAPEVDRLRAEAEAAIRAAEVAPVLDASDRAAAAAESARAAEEAARSVLPDKTALPDNTVPANGTGTPRVAAQDALEAASQQQQAQVVRLETLRLLARDADAEDETATASRNQAAELADELGRAAAAAAQRATARPPAQAARDAARQAAQALPAAQAQAEIARRVATHRAALVRAYARRGELHEAHLAARESAVAAQAAALGVRERRIDGMRAELAAEMTKGSPCPVCGSLDHPDPVDAASFPPVSRGEEEAAFGLASGAAAAAEDAGQQVAAVDAVIHDLAERLAADSARPTASAPAALSAAASEAESDADRHEAAAAELSAAAAHLDDLQLELDALDAAIADDKSTMTELTEQRTAALATAQAAAQRATDRRRELRDQLGDAPDLETALDCASHLAAAFAAAADAAAETTRAEGEAGAAYQRGVQTAVDVGFGRPTSAEAPDEEAPDEGAIVMARAAFRDARWRADIAATVSTHEADARTVETQIADPDLDVGLDAPAPVEETTEAAKAAQQAHDEANTAYGTTRHRTQQLALLRPQLDAAINALQPLRERTDQIRHLADLANGTSGANQYKMTLSSFVLAARLEEVAAAASERLLTMTAGRYSLVHSDARRGNAKAGLSLLACDAWTGIDRDTATLSGGETFLASLALALGLADVVTAESAGTPMEALFVDEGFGTLDEDTLDEVMNVLDSLRAGGRLVGIVSHVTELRQRIPAQVHVRKSRTGSRVEITPG
jgi:exonuclease SbcC